MMTGKVYLVGGGPGDPDLITVKGLELLRRADVVLYDSLVPPQLLNETREQAELIPVGKRAGEHSMSQPEIDALLVAKAQTGRMIVRLKGGDPFVFGHGGEECQALALAGIPFEVVPGVSSAIAGPAYAGIPLTHRELASQFTVITARDRNGALPEWDNLPRSGTLVFLMGMARLAEIAAGLQTHGWLPQTPAAVIEQAATPEQQVAVGTLADIAEKAAGLGSPGIIIVGEVVSLSSLLHWFEPTIAFSYLEH
jgi:uroporphyrin-III C-methyltransferase